MPASTIVSRERGEPLCVGADTLDEQRRYVLTCTDGGSPTWQLEHVDGRPDGFFRLRAENGELLYVGSKKLDANRRLVLTWVGGGDVEGSAAVWQLLPADGYPAGSFRLLNAGNGELLYVGSRTLAGNDTAHMALTWVGGGDVEGAAAVWSIPALAPQQLPEREPKPRANDPLSPNARVVLRRSSQLAAAQNCALVGTEHLLLSLLTVRTDAPDGLTTTARWLAQACGETVEALQAVAREFAATTAGGAERARRSRSLERGIELACAIARPAQTEHLLLGTLLAAELDGHPNAVTKICCERSVTTQLMQGFCGVSAAQLVRAGRECQGGVHEFGIHWEKPVVPATGVAGAIAALADPPADMSGPVPSTHYVCKNLICGKSAGDMSTTRLRDLVAAGVDTFVCLQTSYTEYGCSDYPRQLRELGGAGATREIRFLHCPVPDFGVLSNESLHTLVVELQRELASPEGHVLYVHCMGGHGRTGTVVANLIMALDGVDFAAAMAKPQQCHRGAPH